MLIFILGVLGYLGVQIGLHFDYDGMAIIVRTGVCSGSMDILFSAQ